MHTSVRRPPCTQVSTRTAWDGVDATEPFARCHPPHVRAYFAGARPLFFHDPPDPPVSCIRKPLVTNGRRTSTPSAAGSLWNRLTSWDSTCDACAHVPSIPSTPSTPYGCVPRGWCALACPKVSLVAVACTLPQAPVLVYCGWCGAVRGNARHILICQCAFRELFPQKLRFESCQKIYSRA